MASEEEWPSWFKALKQALKSEQQKESGSSRR
jgi:hypothetical protein